MAAGVLPEPGTEYGPCLTTKGANGVTLTCGHTDCAASRAQAATVCSKCGRAIGYDTRFYNDAEHGLVHARCIE